jgi:preprotein translocase SecE subunit
MSEAKQSKKSGKLSKFNIFKIIAKFCSDFKSELKKIVWPPQKDVLRDSGVVLASISTVGLFVFILDFSFTKILSLIMDVS